MPNQKALSLTSAGEWRVEERAIPVPLPGEVLIRIEATALNPSDWKGRSYTNFIRSYPAVLGSDAAGVVEGFGWGGDKLFKKGDRVLFQGAYYFSYDQGTFQQYAVAPYELISKIPSDLTFEQAATIPLGLATAAFGLYAKEYQFGASLTPPWVAEGEGKYKGKSIVILGGSSSVGQYVIQLAHLSGFSHIIVTSSLKHEAYLKTLGATHVIDRSLAADQVTAQIKRTLNGLADLVYDSISLEDTQRLAFDVSQEDASVILVLGLNANLKPGNRKIIGVLAGPQVHKEIGLQLYKALPDLLESRAIRPNNPAVIGGLDAIEKGLARLEAGAVSGTKLVVNPWK